MSRILAGSVEVNSRNLYPCLRANAIQQCSIHSRPRQTCRARRNRLKVSAATTPAPARPPPASDICGGRLKVEGRRGEAPLRPNIRLREASRSISLASLFHGKWPRGGRTKGKASELTGNGRTEGRGRFTKPFASDRARARRGWGGKAPFS